MTSIPKFRTGLGKCSHRFLSIESTKPCVLAGVIFEDCPGLAARSDGDVVLLSLCHAIASLSGVDIAETVIHDLLQKDGITDSQVYLEKAMHFLSKQKIQHIAITIEAKRPEIGGKLKEMRKKIAEIVRIDSADVGITTVAGDGLTDVSCGEGIESLAVITTVEV